MMSSTGTPSAATTKSSTSTSNPFKHDAMSSQNDGSRQYQEHCTVINSHSGSNNQNVQAQVTATTASSSTSPSALTMHSSSTPVATRLQQLYLQHQLTPNSTIVATPTSTTTAAGNPNVTTTAEEPSYDYYMECANNPNHHYLLNGTLNTVTTNTDNNTNSNNNNYNNHNINNDDTFEDLWQDEVLEDPEDDYTAATTGTEDLRSEASSKISAHRQKRNWKQRAVTALLEQQILKEQQHAKLIFRQQQQNAQAQQTPNASSSVGKPPRPSQVLGASASSPAWFSPQQQQPSTIKGSSMMDDHSAAGSSLQSLPRNGGTILDTSGSVLANSIHNSNTPRQVPQEEEDLEDEPSPIKSPDNSLNQSLPTVNNSNPHHHHHNYNSSGTSSPQRSSQDDDDDEATRPILYPTTTTKKQKKKSNKKHNITPLEEQYQVIRRSKSSPPDPPSYKFLSNSGSLARMPTGDYYDPDEEEDALTNLVITVVGLEGQDDDDDDDDDVVRDTDALIKRNQQRKRHARNKTKQLSQLEEEEATAPSFVDYAAARRADTSQVSSVIPQSASFSDSSSSRGPSSAASSFQTLFLTADATSSILFGALLVLLVPLLLYSMMIWELLDTTHSPVDEWQAFFGIPMNEDVPVTVRIAQLGLLFGWVLLVHQTALVHTTLQLVLGCCRLTRRTSRNQQQGRYTNLSRSFFSNTAVIHDATSHVVVSKTRWFVGTLLEWLQQIAYMVAAVLVLLQATDSVQELLWNMGAVEFVLRLDVLAFLVWSRMGYAFLSLKPIVLAGTTPTTEIHPILTPPTEDTDGSHHHHHQHNHSTAAATAGENNSLLQNSLINHNNNSLVNNQTTPSATTMTTSPRTTSEKRMAQYQRRYHRRQQEEASPTTTSRSHLRSKSSSYQVASFPPIQANEHPLLRILLYFCITSSILLAYAVIVYEQVLGNPVELQCQAIAVQFGDVIPTSEDAMEQYYYASFLSGIYTQRQGQYIRHHGRHIYDFVVQDPRRSKQTMRTPFKIAYCRPLRAWTLSRATAEPCQDYLLRSSPTQAYDLLSLTESVSWHVLSRGGEEAPLDDFSVACADCAHGQGRATSSSSFGYHCINDTTAVNALQDGGNRTMQVPSAPCANLTWDRRFLPFPDVIWKPSSADAKGSLPDYFDNEASAITGGVDPHSLLEIVVGANGNMLKEPHFQRPVYWSHFDDQMVLVMFVGRRWVIVQLRKDVVFTWRSHPERHMERLLSLWTQFAEHWISSSSSNDDSKLAQPEIVPIFLSEPASLSVRDINLATPAGLQWYYVQQDRRNLAVGSYLAVGQPIETVLLCAVCNQESNPCHSGGFCHQEKDAFSASSAPGGQCVCRPGYEGFLCESTSLGCHMGESFVGLCFNDGTCGTSGQCNCPMWKRNQRAFPVRGDVCQYVPNCWEFEDDGMACFEKGTCTDVGCDNGGSCKLDGRCDCDGSAWATSEDTGRYRGKLCQEEVNCYDYEADGKDCVEKGTCSNVFCNGGVCSADGSCEKCPSLAFGRFCQVLPDCFNFEIGGVSTDCFDTGRCTNLGCANEGICQRDGTCSCPGSSGNQIDEEDEDPFYDDDTLQPTMNPVDNNVWYSGKLCQIAHGRSDTHVNSLIGENHGAASGNTSCILSACVANGGQCTSKGICECPLGLSGAECEIVSDCFEAEADGKDCFALGTCTSIACHLRADNSTCRVDGQCECPEMLDKEVYGKLCHKVWPIDDCFEAEEDGKDCLKLGTCSNMGCLNGGTCTFDGSCDCTSLFWGKQCQHARNCFEQEYSCFFNTFLTGNGKPNENIDPTNTPCSDAGCLNNGICQASGDCLCPGGYTGKVCQDALP
ncbi:Teneurin transmembrane protein [Seminavis robusta]|uniref:Teneurin transmembrane protein n=1 Tax=Seminavis robusta TaxID=568900 RepID=A0A9N8H476_9STRA|nr:Teneurin transmembrane protein [Seminavis robusta]|eukprot:Sro55_g032390.1 Teneurin transmembrane protein (1832) ;mRNA; f:95890-101385